MSRAKSWSWLAVLLLAVFFSFSSSAALAGNFMWTAGTGVEGGAVRALAFDGTTLYAGTYGGGVAAWNGVSWVRPETITPIPGIPTGNPYINAINILTILGLPFPFACTEGGVFFSADSGVTWLPFTSNLGPGNSRTTGITFDAGTGSYFVATNGGGVFMSTATGWTPVNTGLTAANSMNVNAIVTDGAGNLFIATNNGVYASPAAIVNWISDSAGPTGGLTNSSVLTLITAGGNLYAGTNGGGFYWAPVVAPPGLLAWTQANGVPPTNLSGLSVRALAENAGTIYAATNAGAFSAPAPYVVWTNLNGLVLNDPEVGDVNLFAVTYNTVAADLLVGSGRGVFRSIAAPFTTWTTLNTGLSPTAVSALLFDPVHPNIAYVATNGGVYKSEDYGNTWTPKFLGMPDKNVTALAVGNMTPNVLYAGTLDGNIYQSKNGGDSWQFFSFLNSRIYDIKFNPTFNSVVWFGAGNGLYRYGPFIYNINMFFKITHRTLMGAKIYTIAIDPSFTMVMYVGTNTADNSFARSTDGGMTWAFGGTAQTDAKSFTRQVLIDPLDTKRVYALTSNEVDPVNPTQVTFGGINMSEDKGTTFFVNEGMKNTASRTYTYLAVDPVFNNKVYAASSQASTLGTVTFTAGSTPAGTNDLVPGGTFVGSVTRNFRVQIDGAGPPNTFSWSINGGTSWVATGVAITGAPQLLQEGVTITFGGTTGHNVGDRWDFTATPAAPPLLFTMSFFGDLFYFDDTGLPATNSIERLAVNPAYPNVLLAGTTMGPYEYEDFYLPAENIMINGGADFTRSTFVSLTCTYRKTSKFMRFSNNGTTWSWWRFVSPTTFWSLPAGTGLKTVYAQFKDRAGFITGASDNIFLDATRPAFASVVINPGVPNGAAQTLTITALDDVSGSGIKEFRLSNSTIFRVDPNNPLYSDWFPFSALVNPVPWNLRIGGAATATIRVYGQFRDNAGNILQVASLPVANGINPPTFLNAAQDPLPLPQNIVYLSWDDNADNELAYVIERQRTLPTLTPFAAVAIIRSTTLGELHNSYTNIITTGSGTYVYRIRVLGYGINIIGAFSAPVVVP